MARARRRGFWRAGAVAVAAPMAVCLAVVAVGYDGQHFVRGDGLFYLVTARSLMVDGDLEISNQLAPPLPRWSGHVALDRRGRVVPKHPIAFAVASVPFLAALGPPGALVFNLLLLATAFAVAFLLAQRVARPWPAAAAVVATALGSFLPHYAWNYSADLFATVLLVAGLALLTGDRGAERPWAAVAGLLLGSACAAKYAMVVAAAWAAVLVREPRRVAVPLLAGVAIPLLAVAALNLHLFGSPLTTGYDRMVDLHGDNPRLASDRDRLGWPSADQLGDLLLAPRHGFARTAPVTVLALAALPLLWARDRRLAVAVAGAAASLLLVLAVYLEGRVELSSHFGNRYLIPVVVLGAVPLAALLDRLARPRAAAGHPVAPDS